MESARLVLGRHLGIFQPWSLKAKPRQPRRAQYMLILVLVLMRCQREKSGFDRRPMAEAALTMRDVMSLEEQSLVIQGM